MKNNRPIQIGDRFGRLTVVEYCGISIIFSKRQRMWKCKCDCGKTIYTTTGRLNYGLKSCGCLSLEKRVLASKIACTKHGMTDSKEYHVWCGLRQRCYNSNNAKYKNYGARGIKVCERWLHSFENFYADMGEMPDGCSIDRIDVNGDYCPENCRWVDQKTQQNNRRNNTKITFNGVTETLRYWSEKTGIDPRTLYHRLHDMKWSAEKTIMTPLLRQKV